LVVASLFRYLEKRLLRGLAIIFAEQSYEADHLDLNSPKITVLNLPIAEEILAIESEKYKCPTVGYIGTISPLRGSLATARALRLLNQEMEVDWECIGHIDRSHQQELIQTMSETHAHCLRLRGRMNMIDGLKLVSKCHAGLALLANTPNYHDSFPTKMFEYMALGVPVVVSDFPLYRQVVEQARCGICVDPDDVRGIADAIRWLILHPAEAFEMGQRGRSAVFSRYNWTHEGEKLLGFYRTLMSMAQNFLEAREEQYPAAV
jgi:glycosyltransferase involved in cell wall biosynthesis